MKALAAFAVAACLANASPSLAQPSRLPKSAEILRSTAIAERNQLGLLEYCNHAGHISAEAVTRQRNIVAALPPSPSTAHATEDGQNGLIAFEESRITLAADAAGQGISVAYSCFQLALRVMGAP
jgi:hypothetical protein